MKISARKLQCLRKHFATEVVACCSFLGLKPDDFELRMEVAKGVLTVSAVSDEFELVHSERVRVGSMQPRFQEHLLASFKLGIDTAFKAALEPLAAAA